MQKRSSGARDGDAAVWGRGVSAMSDTPLGTWWGQPSRPRGAKEPRRPHELPAGDGNDAGDAGAARVTHRFTPNDMGVPVVSAIILRRNALWCCLRVDHEDIAGLKRRPDVVGDE